MFASFSSLRVDTYKTRTHMWNLTDTNVAPFPVVRAHQCSCPPQTSTAARSRLPGHYSRQTHSKTRWSAFTSVLEEFSYGPRSVLPSRSRGQIERRVPSPSRVRGPSPWPVSSPSTVLRLRTWKNELCATIPYQNSWRQNFDLRFISGR